MTSFSNKETKVLVFDGETKFLYNSTCRRCADFSLSLGQNCRLSWIILVLPYNKLAGQRLK